MQLRGCHCGWMVIAVVAVAFAVLNFLTPEYHDDFVYKFMFEGGTVNYDHPVRTIGDIVASQVEHYQSVNGRSLVHFLVQLFTGLLGKPIFNLLNALVFALFLLLLGRRACRNVSGDGRDIFVLTLTLALVLLLPRFMDTFLWMTGSVNYLWSATAVLLFLVMYERRRMLPAGWGMALPLVVALLAGWTHEGITLPLAISLVIVNLRYMRSNGGKQGLWLALAFLAGACLTALAPGTLARSGETGGLSASSLGLKAVAGITVLSQLRLVYLALLLGIILWFRDREAVKRVLARDAYLVLAAVLSLGIVFYSGQTLTRSAFGLELFSLMIVLSLVGEAMPRWNANVLKWLGVALVVALVAFYALLLRHSISSWQESQRLIAQIEQSPDGIVGTREHDAGLFNRYIRTMISRDATAGAVNYDPAGWPASIAATYGRDSLVFLPQTFLDDLHLHSERFDTLALDTPFEFYVCRIGGDEQIGEVRFLLGPNEFSDVPWLFRPIARRMNRYTDTIATTRKWATVTLDGRRYLLIKKDRDVLPRVREVQVIPSP